MTRVMKFDEALKDAKRRSHDLSVLLGNGFSIDYDSGTFTYESLAEEARLSGLTINKEELFESLGSRNFEIVIDNLRAAAKLQRIYSGDEALADTMEADALTVRNGLADTLASRHPDKASVLTDDEVVHARTFLSHFRRIHTLSYDLLLYWVINKEATGVRVPRTDGFEWPTLRDQSRLIWKSKPIRPQRVFFLHGALHFFVEGRRLTKLKTSYGSSIIDALRERLNALEYPIVVTEGTRTEKEARIERSTYLRTGLRRFGELSGVLFLHGVSMSRNDDHILESIEADSSKFVAIYVSLHGDPASPDARLVIERANEVKERRKKNGGRKLKVKFYSAQSANVWRDNS